MLLDFCQELGFDMDFDFTAEQKALAQLVHSLATKRLAGEALRRAHEPGYAWDASKILADHSLLGFALPVEVGGQGAGLLDAVIALQETAKICPKSGDVIQATSFGAIQTLVQHGSSELKARYLPELLAGEGLLALAMSEPDVGSAVTDLTTTAVSSGSDYLINGSKVFSTNSVDATAFMVYVRFGPGTDGIGSVIIDHDTPGFTRGVPSEFMSGERWSQLFFDDCRIPESSVVLGLGGFKRQINVFNIERIGNAARALALGRLAFERARQYATEREQFGRKLCDFQGIQWKFADMAVKLDAAELLLYRAAINADKRGADPYEVSVAKLAANQASFEVSHEAVQVMGALGYTRDTLVEYCFLRTRGWMIAGGSLEMMKNRIAEGIFDRRFSQRPLRSAQ